MTKKYLRIDGIQIGSVPLTTTGNLIQTGGPVDLSNSTIAWTSVTGRPTAVSSFTNDSNYANVNYVDSTVANLVASAPETLNTLNELALALNSDANFSTTITALIGTKANTSSLANVAFSGNYSALLDKPTLVQTLAITGANLQVTFTDSTTTNLGSVLGYTGSQGVIGATGPQGIQGNIGYTGSEGIQGATGPQGTQGNIGYTGSQGIQGVTGYDGSIGATGPQGIQGNIGYTGSQGIQGDIGATGPQGIQGNVGYTGSQGAIGITGYTGSQGVEGSIGATGLTGATGPQGIQGNIGYTGSQGITGSTGIAGNIGYTGSEGVQGIQGNVGYTGSQGIQGDIGATGPQGIQGNVGYTGSEGIQGATGPQGIQGNIGYTGSQGITGATGPQGNIGYTGSQGIVGDAGATGPQGGTGYTGSQGTQGNIGYTGSAGTNGTIGYTGSQGDQGTQGNIGYTGSAGTNGTIGYTGSQGTQGNIGYTGSAGTIPGSAGQIIYRNSSNVATGSDGLSYDGVSLKVNGNLESTYSNGNEGGEIFLSNAATNTTLVSGVTIDVHQDRLRFFEAGGTNRGAYIDITKFETGVGTNLAVHKASAPSTNKGATGDTKGQYAISGSDLYVCNANYTDGTANIWVKFTGTTSW